MRVPSQPASVATIERAGLGRPQAVAVWTTWVVALGLAVLGLVEALPSGLGTAAFAAATLLVVLPTVTVGALLVTRLPHHIVGWLLLAGGVSFAVGNGFGALADYGLNVHPGSVPGAIWFAVFSQALNGTFMGLLWGYVPLYFPTGRLPSRRWWPVPVLAAVPTFVAPVANLFVPFTPGTSWGSETPINEPHTMNPSWPRRASERPSWHLRVAADGSRIRAQAVTRAIVPNMGFQSPYRSR